VIISASRSRGLVCPCFALHPPGELRSEQLADSQDGLPVAVPVPDPCLIIRRRVPEAGRFKLNKRERVVANFPSRLLHDLGLAAWFGGTLANAVALNRAAGQVSDPSSAAG
jgi:hypothetical protein